jgi:site-specific DNA recombinase
VIRKIKEGILTEENLIRIVELVNQDMDISSIEYQNELKTILQDFSDTNHRLEHLYDAVEIGKIPFADLAPRIHELKARQDKLQERKIQIEGQLSDRKVELASPQIVRRFTSDMRKVLESSEFTEKRAFIRSFVQKIKVTGDQALLTYTAPLNGLLEEKIGVLPIVQYGGW